jgi:uncharacterized repeat protein (TIGR01451 family)
MKETNNKQLYLRGIIPLAVIVISTVVASYAFTSPRLGVSASQLSDDVESKREVLLAYSSTAVTDLSASSKYLADTLFAPGDQITYTIVISNNGTAKAFGASMVDSLPAGLILNPVGLTASQGAVIYDGTVITWTGALLPGTGAFVTVPVTISTSEWPITNTATLSETRAATTVSVSAFAPEGFESHTSVITPTFPPARWGTESITGTSAFWSQVITSTATNPAAMPYRGQAMTQFNSYFAQTNDAARLYTRVLRFPGDFEPVLTFGMYHDSDTPQVNNRNDRIQVQISIDGGSTYSNIPNSIFTRYEASNLNQWSQETVSLCDYAGRNDVRIGFLGVSDFGNNMYVDEIGLRYVPLSGTILVDPAQPLVNQPITFTGVISGSTDQVSKTWNFGDNTPIQKGILITHSYTAIGSYNVSMLLCGLEVSRTVYVSANPEGIDASLQTSSPTLFDRPTYFTATVSSATNPVTVTWRFGEVGAISAGLMTSHTYAAPGPYNVTATITNAMKTISVTMRVEVLADADLVVAQFADPIPVKVAQPLTYTIVISDQGRSPATAVMFTDTLPINAAMSVQTINAAGFAADQCGHGTVVVTCTLGTLNSGGSVTITLVVKAGKSVTATNHVVVTGAEFDPNSSNNSSDLTLHIDTAHLYFPAILVHFPLIPDAPVLARIDNSLLDISYDVQWTAVLYALSYTLQEDTSPSFGNPINRYVGPGKFWSAQNKPKGTYYYRVRASNVPESSAWSNTQSVSVTLQYDGNWSGTTSQNRSIGFNITQNALTSLTFQHNNAGCLFAIDKSIYPAIGLSGNTFSYSSSGATYYYVVIGSFTSPLIAAGSISMNTWDITGNPPCVGSSVATWTATKK